MSIKGLVLSLGTALVISVTGCNLGLPDPAGGPGDAASQDTPASASARVEVNLPKADAARVTASPEDVTRVMLEVTWEGGGTPAVAMFKKSTYRYELVVDNLPVGVPCTLEAQALAGGALLYSGLLEDVTLAAGQMATLTLNLVALDAAAEGRGPRVVGVERPGVPVEVERIVPVRITVADPDDAALHFSFSSARDGTFAPATGDVALQGGVATVEVQYRAPTTPGVVLLTLNFEDAHGLAVEYTFGLTIVPVVPVQEAGGLSAGVNFPPTVNSITSQPIAGASQLWLAADVTDDSPPEALNYKWETAGTTFSTQNPALLNSGQGVLAVTLTVTDAQGAATIVRFDVDSTDPTLGVLAITNRAPVVVGAFLSGQDVAYGPPVTLLLYTLDLDGNELSATWSTDHGSMGAQTKRSEGQYQVFQADWLPAVQAGEAQVTVRVADPLQAAVIYVFTIREVLGQVGLTANAGPDQGGFLNEPLQLDGTASHSDDGVIVQYQWQRVSGPASTIGDPNAAQTTVATSTTGTYVYRLTVWNVNNTASDTVSIVVTDPLAFSFSIADMAGDGIVYFLDTTSKLVRRYDTSRRKFLPSWSTGLDTVTAMAVAPASDTVYVGFNTGRMDQFETATGNRTVFSSAPASIVWLMVVENYIFCIDTSGAWETHSLFNRATGIRTFADDWRNSSYGSAYAPTIKAIFTFRDGSSPNDIYRTAFDPVAGTLGTDMESPYHGDYGLGHPMRLFPDESKIAVGSGVLFSTSDLTYVGSIGIGYKDLVFHDGRLYLIRAFGQNMTEFVVLSGSFSTERTQTYQGKPLRLWRGGDSFFLFTERGTNQLGMEVFPVNP